MIHQTSIGQFAIREVHCWRQIQGENTKPEFYNLNKDLSEDKNVIDQYPEIAASLKK